MPSHPARPSANATIRAFGRAPTRGSPALQTPTPMEIDPATICARTSAGEAELDAGEERPHAPAAQGAFAARGAAGLCRIRRRKSPRSRTPRARFHPPRRARPDLAAAGVGRHRSTHACARLGPPPRHAPAARRAAKSGSARAGAGLARIRNCGPSCSARPPAARASALAALAGVGVIALTAGWLALRDGPQATPRVDAAAIPASAPLTIRESRARRCGGARHLRRSTATPAAIRPAPPAARANSRPPRRTRPVATDEQARDATAGASRVRQRMQSQHLRPN